MHGLEKRWTNLEDEILKAGVMKYGLQNWSKITSLLDGKTPRDCKLRWKQIQPTNTEFSNEERIKLIDCVKIFKAQWTTISKCFESKCPEQCRNEYNRIVFECSGTQIENKEKEISDDKIGCKDKEDFENNDREISENKQDKINANRPKEKCLFVDGNRIAEIDYSSFNEDERDKIDFVRARLTNKKSRKNLKRKKISKNL